MKFKYIKKLKIDFERTSLNSARDQGACPHCDAESKGYIFCPREDADCFMGYAPVGLAYVYVFRCRECHELFWYHTTEFYMKGVERLWEVTLRTGVAVRLKESIRGPKEDGKSVNGPPGVG